MDDKQLLLIGIRARKAELQDQLDALDVKERQLLGGGSPVRGRKAAGKRQISDETRKKMADAARQRWAAKKAGTAKK